MTNSIKAFDEYQALRRTNPDLYYKATTQQQMHECFLELGSSFFEKLKEANHGNKESSGT